MKEIIVLVVVILIALAGSVFAQDITNVSSAGDLPVVEQSIDTADQAIDEISGVIKNWQAIYYKVKTDFDWFDLLLLVGLFYFTLITVGVVARLIIEFAKVFTDDETDAVLDDISQWIKINLIDLPATHLAKIRNITLTKRKKSDS